MNTQTNADPGPLQRLVSLRATEGHTMKLNKRFLIQFLVTCTIFMTPAIVTGQSFMEALLPPCLGCLLARALWVKAG